MVADSQISGLQGLITDEILAAFGVRSKSWLRGALAPIFWLPSNSFARMIAKIDGVVGEEGLQAAAADLLPRFTDDVLVSGIENVPPEGPLLIASNHPGAYDGVAILANIMRQDVKLVVSDVPFIRSLPAISSHMIYTPASIQSRMAAIRALIRHLKTGGAALIFASGRVDPDPALLPGASENLGLWSSSLELVMRQVPQTRLLVSIVSGVLAPACLHSPLTRLVDEPWRRLKLAEFLQVIQQLVLKRNFGLRPQVYFDLPHTASELLAEAPSADLQGAIIQRAREALALHLAYVETS